MTNLFKDPCWTSDHTDSKLALSDSIWILNMLQSGSTDSTGDNECQALTPPLALTNLGKRFFCLTEIPQLLFCLISNLHSV